MRFDAVCIGASHGGFDLLLKNLPALAVDFPVPILVCLHLPSGSGGDVADHLNARSAIRVQEAGDKQATQPGHVYLAPGGYHLLVERDASLSLSADEPCLHARPSINVLFESAAIAWGNRLVGVLLSGASSDGAAGLATIQRCGGYTLVQRPDTAKSPVMPQAALDTMQPDQVLDGDQLAEALTSLMAESAEPRRTPETTTP